MSLLPHDKLFLDGHRFNYKIEELPNETILIIYDYKLSSMFDLEKTNVIIRIPNGYPMSQLDMFWVQPYIKLKETGSYPQNADYFEDILGQKWQRFSRHYPWKPHFSLTNHLSVVKEVLVDGRG